jgi:murein DD-endopeptidase MepM/ murein hydrolase activator NlpD
MNIPNRPIQQRDLKNLGIIPTPAKTHHFVLGSFTALALLVIYIAINTPSASTGNLSDNTSSSMAEPVQPAYSENTDPNLTLASLDTGFITDNLSAASSSLASNEPIDDQSRVETGIPDDAVEADHSQSANLDKTAPANISESPAEVGVITKPLPEAVAVKPEPVKVNPLIAYLDSQPWEIATVRKGDTLSQLFNRFNLESREAYKVASLEEAAPLLKIRPGQKIRLKKTEDGRFGQLHYQLNDFEALTLTLADDSAEVSYIANVLTREPEIRINNAMATITHSVLGAAVESGVSYQTMYQFIALFGWQVDFSMDIHKGDTFSLIYEEHYLDDKKVGDGEIIAAELNLSGKKFQAIRYINDEDYTDYFAPNGNGIKGTFLRSPLKFGNITSTYSKKRLHPIKKVWRAHKGVDYGAQKGTPIMATGNGTVVIAGRKNGYGKTVVIRHGGKYETLYAHMNGYAKGIKSGARVNQGDVIGYVGQTGLATGPHLHYEFRIHGIHKNPVTVAFPKSEPIDDKYRFQFQQVAGIWVSELDNLNRISLASALISH